MNDITTQIDGGPLPSIVSSLCELKSRLLRMVQSAEVQTGQPPGMDKFRGLYVSEADVCRYLTAENALIPPSGDARPLARGAAFAAVGELYGLSGIELDTLLIATAPDLDPKFEQIFAYLQDDVACRRPSVDLVLSVLCTTAADKFEKRALFAGSGTLLANGLIRLLGNESLSLARCELSAAPAVVAFLLGEWNLDTRLARFARLLDAPPPNPPPNPCLTAIARRAPGNRLPLRLYFQGRDEEEKRDAAAAFAAALSAPLLVVDVGRASRHAADLEEWMRELTQAAFLRHAIVYLEGLDAISGQAARDTILDVLPAFRSVTIVSGERDLRTDRVPAAGMVTVVFARPGWPERRLAWQSALRVRGLDASGKTLDMLAECFRFTRSEIEDAAETAANLAAYRGQNGGAAFLFDAARSRSGHELAALTQKIAAGHGWTDLVLPEDAMEQLYEICRRVTLRHLVLGRWGFAGKLSGGKGVNALFHGHSGTGKTMAAEVIARELQLDLYKIDLAGVVSKYIGETEKNLDRIFAAAEDASAILLFDEADALFGKRSEVRDSHDRYANLEVSYLLQKMEQHDGVSILATNLRQNLDDAFLRRLAFTVHFPFPDEASRRRIWAGIWPKETPLAHDVDAGWLAARFMLNDCNIRNVAFAAAFLAAPNESVVTLSHVLRAVRTEFQQMGKSLNAAELAPPLSVASETAA